MEPMVYVMHVLEAGRFNNKPIAYVSTIPYTRVYVFFSNTQCHLFAGVGP